MQSAKSGSIVKKGEIEAYVTATGKNTYIGEAMALVGKRKKIVINLFEEYVSPTLIRPSLQRKKAPWLALDTSKKCCSILPK